MTDREPDTFTVDIQDFSGPLNRLVEEVERKRIDIATVPLLFIVERFLDWFRQAMDTRLEVAADWLLAAARLAALKARLLANPSQADQARITLGGEDVRLTAARKEALRTIVEDLQRRRRLGVHWFDPGPGDDGAVAGKRLEASLHGLLLSYVREAGKTLVPAAAPVRAPYRLASLEAARKHVSLLCEGGLDWTDVLDLLPPEGEPGTLHAKSLVAVSYVACLQLAKDGRAEVAQHGPGSVRVRGLVA